MKFLDKVDRDFFKRGLHPLLEFSDLISNAPDVNRILGDNNPIKFEISEDDNTYYIDAHITGVKKEDISINLEDNILNISAERKQQNEKKNRKFTTREIYYGQFKKGVSLPDNADTQKIHAKYENGTLEITIPKIKTEEKKAKSVNIE